MRLLGGTGFPHNEQGGTAGLPFMKVSDLESPGAGVPVTAAANYVDDHRLQRLQANVAPTGSVLMPKIGAAVRGQRRRVLIGCEVAFDNNVLALVPAGIDSRYLAYWISQLDVEPYIQPGAVATLDISALGAAQVPLADRSAQSRVADLLDHQLAQLDRLIAVAARLEEVQQEAYEALLVGLFGPSAGPLVQIRFVAKPGTGHTPSRTCPDYWIREACAVPWFTLGDVWQIRDDQKEVVTETAEHISDVGLAQSSAVLHPAETVVLSRTASIGYSAVMGQPMAVSQDFMTWTCSRDLDPYFLLYALRAMRPTLRALMTGSTHKTIYMPDLLRLKCPVPPVEVQRERVCEARLALEHHWALRARVRMLIERLREYRGSLITTMVAGNGDAFRALELQDAV